MSEQKISPEVPAAQSPEENSIQRKRGTEIVRSAELTSGFFRISHRRRRFGFPVFNDDAWSRRLSEASV